MASEQKLEVTDEGNLEIKGGEENDKVQDPDEIRPSDRTKPFSVAQFKRWRKDLMANMNGVLQAFQKDVIGSQVRVNLAWNAMNAVILALVKKGLLTENDIRQAGADLMQQAQENLKKAKAAADAGTSQVFAKPTPIEQIRDEINAEVKKREASGG